MTRIKICGITTQEDADAAVAYGADALGFNGVPASPRFISEARYASIAEYPPLFVQRVIVVQKPEDADAYLGDYVQYYEETTNKAAARRNVQWRIRSFRIKDESSLKEIEAFSQPVSAILLDTYNKEVLGGSGETFNWELAVEAKRMTGKPIVLAGGLTPDNIQDALEAVRPYAVDVASGVELSPGIKDHAKMRAFIRAVREWDMKQL